MPTCRLADCSVAVNGRCLEGAGAECPNLDRDAIPSLSPAEKNLEQDAPAPIFETLPGIAPLEISEARHFSRRGRAIIVALAGMPDCGKTSLLARLHQIFQAGPLAGYDFAGSRSLPRFEELNWMAMIESKLSRPRMLHSSAQFDNSFLHLAVRKNCNSPRVDLLLNDISGETFKAAVASQVTCQELFALRRADHLVVLVDGAELESQMRFHHINQVEEFLQRVSQGRQCGINTALHVVVSKNDQLKSHATVAATMEANFDGRFRGVFGNIWFWRIAARPMDGTLPTTETITKLFECWMQTTFRYPSTALSPIPRTAWSRDFCRYDG